MSRSRLLVFLLVLAAGAFFVLFSGGPSELPPVSVPPPEQATAGERYGKPELQRQSRGTLDSPGHSAPAPSASQDVIDADADACRRQVDAAFRNETSGFMVTCPGRVARVLPDDNEGSRHQRFILDVSGSRTLLVAHNIDLAPKAPLQQGDSVIVRGQYEWNNRGGVLHWTHHDPRGRRAGGWLEVDGQRYK
ncbi:MAG: DUF3465 domain-containing protein [Acidobacteriota bacterium]